MNVNLLNKTLIYILRTVFFFFFSSMACFRPIYLGILWRSVYWFITFKKLNQWFTAPKGANRSTRLVHLTGKWFTDKYSCVAGTWCGLPPHYPVKWRIQVRISLNSWISLFVEYSLLCKFIDLHLRIPAYTTIKQLNLKSWVETLLVLDFASCRNKKKKIIFQTRSSLGEICITRQIN